jgi:16S rRNA (guanine527-N7)-methyltransferase
VNSEPIEREIREAGLKERSPGVIAQFQTYLELLLKWNAKLNLTSVREPEAIIRRHFIECIQCAQALPVPTPAPTLLDFGSGAGLPGIPIAICRPEIRVTLGESQRKKASFLREAVRSLGLNAEVFDGRIEEMPPERRFSIVTLRAVDKMTDACRSALARMAPQGWLTVFATKATRSGIEAVLPEIEWRQTVSGLSLDKGDILFGQRRP